MCRPFPPSRSACSTAGSAASPDALPVSASRILARPPLRLVWVLSSVCASLTGAKQPNPCRSPRARCGLAAVSPAREALTTPAALVSLDEPPLAWPDARPGA